MMAKLSSKTIKHAACRMSRLLFARTVVVVVLCGLLASSAPGATPVVPDSPGLKPILDYISSGWDTLTRSMTECQSVVDPKIKVAPVLSLPAGLAEPAAVEKLTANCNVRVEHLPLPIHHLGEIDTSTIQPHGLL